MFDDYHFYFGVGESTKLTISGSAAPLNFGRDVNNTGSGKTERTPDRRCHASGSINPVKEIYVD